jgi:hypothetical protein
MFDNKMFPWNYPNNAAPSSLVAPITASTTIRPVLNIVSTLKPSLQKNPTQPPLLSTVAQNTGSTTTTTNNININNNNNNSTRKRFNNHNVNPNYNQPNHHHKNNHHHRNNNNKPHQHHQHNKNNNNHQRRSSSSSSFTRHQNIKEENDDYIPPEYSLKIYSVKNQDDLKNWIAERKAKFPRIVTNDSLSSSSNTSHQYDPEKNTNEDQLTKNNNENSNTTSYPPNKIQLILECLFHIFENIDDDDDKQ